MPAYCTDCVRLAAAQPDTASGLWPVSRPRLQTTDRPQHAGTAFETPSARHTLRHFAVYPPARRTLLPVERGGAAGASEAEAEARVRDVLGARGTVATAGARPFRDAAPPDARASLLESKIGSGEKLSEELRGYFEPRFGVDFSRVRLHRGPAAAAEAHRYGARAFTFGQHVVLGRGAPEPATREGRSLLAHELAHVQQQDGGPPIVQRQKEEWSISPDAPEEERLDALVAAVRERIRAADAETLARVQQIFAADWRARDLATMPEARGPNKALTKEALLTEGVPGRMVEQTSEDVPRIFSALMLSDLLICLGIFDDEKEAKTKIAEFTKDSIEAALDELYTSLPGLVTPPPAPPALADLGTEHTAVESFPFPLSIRPKIEFDIPAAPEARRHPLEPRLSVSKRVVRPGSEITVKATAERSSWIYLLAARDENATLQTTEDVLVAEPQQVSEAVRGREFFFPAPQRPGIYQVRLVSWEDEIQARETVLVMPRPRPAVPSHEPPLDPHIA